MKCQMRRTGEKTYHNKGEQPFPILICDAWQRCNLEALIDTFPQFLSFLHAFQEKAIFFHTRHIESICDCSYL